jgi:hypothetical protein
VEFLRIEYGKKRKPPTESVKEELRKACRCHLTLALGLHKGRCNFHPTNLRAIMAKNATNREHIEQQLRLRTTLSPTQKNAAPEHLSGRSLSDGQVSHSPASPKIPNPTASRKPLSNYVV